MNQPDHKEFLIELLKGAEIDEWHFLRGEVIIGLNTGSAFKLKVEKTILPSLPPSAQAESEDGG